MQNTRSVKGATNQNLPFSFFLLTGMRCAIGMTQLSLCMERWLKVWTARWVTWDIFSGILLRWKTLFLCRHKSGHQQLFDQVMPMGARCQLRKWDGKTFLKNHFPKGLLNCFRKLQSYSVWFWIHIGHFLFLLDRSNPQNVSPLSPVCLIWVFLYARGGFYVCIWAEIWQYRLELEVIGNMLFCRSEMHWLTVFSN